MQCGEPAQTDQRLQARQQLRAAVRVAMPILNVTKVAAPQAAAYSKA